MKKITVEMISDVMCPWCWIGKRNIEKAINLGGDKYEVSVKWLPFLLRPDTPKEGAAKEPNSQSNPRVGSHLRQMGLNVGIDFTGKSDVTPNTIMSHNLLHFAENNAGVDVQNDIQEALFHAYFTDGNVLGIEFLLKVAVEAGLSAEKVRAYIESEEANEKTLYEANLHRRKGVQSIPFCIVNGQPMLAGAQPEEAYLNVFSEALEII